MTNNIDTVSDKKIEKHCKFILFPKLIYNTTDKYKKMFNKIIINISIYIKFTRDCLGSTKFRNWFVRTKEPLGVLTRRKKPTLSQYQQGPKVLQGLQYYRW